MEKWNEWETWKKGIQRHLRMCATLQIFSKKKKKKFPSILTRFLWILFWLTRKKRIIGVFIGIFMIFCGFFFPAAHKACLGKIVAQGIPSCALCFLQLPRLLNNGLQPPVHKHIISCTFSAPIVWSCLKTSYGAKRIEMPTEVSLPSVCFGSTKQLNQYNLGEKNPYNGGTLLFPALTLDEFYFTMPLGIKYFWVCSDG